MGAQKEGTHPMLFLTCDNSKYDVYFKRRGERVNLSHGFPGGSFLSIRRRFIELIVFALVIPAISFAEDIQPVIITCLGDSVTHSYPYGLGDGQEDISKTYPGQLATLLDEDQLYQAKNFEVHNHGINGETAGGLWNKLDPGHPDFANLLQHDPDFVLLMIGGNDIADATPETLSAIIDETVIEVGSCIEIIKEHTNSDGSHPTLIFSTFIPNNLEEGILGSLGTYAIGQYNSDLNTAWAGSGWQAMLEDDDIKIETNWNLWTASPPGLRESYGIFDRALHAYMQYPENPDDKVHPNDQGYGVLAANFFDALGTFPSLTDTDSDGLWNDEEDTDGDGEWNEGVETNFGVADTDVDGVSDFVEVTCADVATAIEPNAKPTIRVNFQPLRIVPPDLHVYDGGQTFTAGKGFGW